MTLHITVSQAKTIERLCEEGIFMGTFLWDGPRGYDLPQVARKLARIKPKIKFDVGSITQTGGIAALANSIGWNRLELNYPDLPAQYLAYAAGMPDVPKPKNYDKLIGFPKIDTHWHTGQWKIGFEPRTSPSVLGADILKFGIKMAVSSSILALDGDLFEGNRQTYNFCKNTRNRAGLCVINPLQVAKSITQIRTYRNQFVGLKTIQDDFEGGLMHPGYREIIREAPEDWPVMAHLPGLSELASLMPERKFIAAHATWGWRALVALPNVYFDVATTARHSLDEIVSTCPGRVLFSSDAPLISPAFTLGKLAALDLTEYGLRRILWDNALIAFPRLGAKLARQQPPTVDIRV